MKNKISHIVLWLLIFLGFSIENKVFPQRTNATIWPQFRGINGSGIAQPDQVSPVYLDSDELLLWKSPVITGESSPCIWGDRIFLTGFNTENLQLHVMCYNRLNGRLTWKRRVPAKEIEPFHRSASPADGTPASDGERVYAHFGSYGLLCYDMDGNLIWDYKIPVNADKFGTGTSPILADNLVILMVRRLSTKERYLLALDKWNGEQVWKQDLVEAGYSTPVIWRNDVVIHCEGFVAGYNVENGSRSWNLLVRTHGESSPIVHDNTLYVNTWHFLGHYDFKKNIPELKEFLETYDLNQDSRISRKEFSGELFMAGSPENETSSGASTTAYDQIWNWFDMDKNDVLDQVELQRYLNFFIAHDLGILAIRPTGAGEVSSNKILWRGKENVAEVPSPLFYKDRIYVIKNGGYFSCAEAATGKLLYKERIKGTGPYFASPVAANNHIYVASHNGKLVVLEAGDEFKIVSETSFGENILATPAIVDNKLYIRTSDHLYAFGD